MTLKFQFEAINFPVDYLPLIIRNGRYAGLIMSLIFPLTGLMYYLERSLLKIPLFIYSSLYFTLGVGSVTIYIMAVRYRLDTIITVLKLCLHRRSIGKFLLVKEVSQNDDIPILRALADIYSDLIHICEEINVCFGFQLMVSYGLIFFYTLFTSFSAYTDLINEGFLTPITLTSATFCLYFNFFLTNVVLTCSMVENRVRFKYLE